MKTTGCQPQLVSLSCCDEQLTTPHNNLFHFALSQLPNARSLIETQLDEAALSVLDLGNLKLESGSFVDADLREKFSDLLFSAPLEKNRDANGAKETLIYFLFEHKSQSDAFTAFQLLSYWSAFGRSVYGRDWNFAPSSPWWCIMERVVGLPPAVCKNW
jgi:predicted transposase/invertase (TIGR01784 family)